MAKDLINYGLPFIAKWMELGKKTILHEITQSQKDKYGMWYHLYMEAGHATIHIIAEVM